MALRQIETEIPNDLRVLGNGAEFLSNRDELDYLWFQTEEWEHKRKYSTFRVVKLTQLAELPAETGNDPALLTKMRQVFNGLYQLSADCDFVHLACNVTVPFPLGVVQMYGMSGLGNTLEEAIETANRAQAALIAGLRGNFKQIRMRPPDSQITSWLSRSFRKMHYALTTIGNPDPHQAATDQSGKHMLRSNGAQGKNPIYSEQQNEIFFRGLVAEDHEFIWMTLAHRISTEELSQLLIGAADAASAWRSRSTGARSINFGIAMPIALSMGNGLSTGNNFGHSSATAQGNSYGETQGVAHGVTNSDTVGGSHVVGTSDTHGTTHNVGVSSSFGRTVSHSDGTSLGTAHGVTTSQSETDSIANSHTSTNTSSISTTDGRTASSNWSKSMGEGSTTGTGTSATNANGNNDNHGTSFNPGGVGHTDSSGKTTTTSDGTNTNAGTNSSDGITWGGGGGSSHSTTASESASESFGSTVGHATTRGLAESNTTSRGTSTSDGTSDSETHGTSESWGTSDAHGTSEAFGSNWSKGTAISDSTSQGISRGISNTRSAGINDGQSVGFMRNIGASAALAPSIGVSKSYNWVDESAMQVAETFERMQVLLREAVGGGGWYADVYTLVDTPEALSASEAMTRQAFSGTHDSVAMSVRARHLEADEQAHIRLHAATFTPSTMREEARFAKLAYSAYRHATVLTPLHLSTYTSPSSMLQARAALTLEVMPDFRFAPDLGRGEAEPKAVIGHQYSSETGQLTNAPVVLSEQRHTHTLFQGDTESGKSEAAYRLALTCWQWGHRVIVLDFAKGWDKFFTSEIPRKYFELYQLTPGAARPLRWPILMIPRLIDPESYVQTLCKIITNAGSLGPVQTGMLQGTLRDLYIQRGVLLMEDKVIRSPEFGVVRDAEVAALSAWGITAGTPIDTLDAASAQALSVYRSRSISLTAWIDIMEAKIDPSVKGVTERERQAYASILYRLRALTFGEIGRMFGALGQDEDGIAIEDIGLPPTPGDRPGFVVLQGGDRLDEFSRSLILALFAVVTYQTAKIRFDQAGGRAPFATDTFWEEAQKVISSSAMNSTSTDGAGSAAATIDMFVEMWRDGRRYRNYQHCLVQNLSQLPPGIVPSSNNAFFFTSKDERDQAMILTYLSKSAKGFVDQNYARFLARMPIGMGIAKFGRTNELAEKEPILMRAMMVPMVTPTDKELRDYYHGVSIIRRWANES